MTHPLPTELPTSEAIQLVIDAVNNRQVDYWEAAHIAWHIAGYGIYQFHEHPPGPFGSIEAAKCASDEMIVEQLESLKGEGLKASIPWNLFVPILLALVERLLKKVTTP